MFINRIKLFQWATKYVPSLFLNYVLKNKTQEMPMTNELLFWDKVLVSSPERYQEHPMGERASKSAFGIFSALKLHYNQRLGFSLAPSDLEF